MKRAMSLSPRSRAFVLIAAAVAAVASCASVPLARTDVEWLAALPEDQTFYAVVDVAKSRMLIAAALEVLGMQGNEVETVLDRSDRVYAASLLRIGESPEFHAVAVGRYPLGVVRMALACRSDWQRVKQADGTVWFRHASGASVHVSATGYLYLTTADTDAITAGGTGGPDVPLEAAWDMIFDAAVVYFPTVPGSFPSLSRGKDDPIRDFWITLQPAEEDADIYNLAVTFRLRGEDEARTFALVLRFLLVGLMKEAGVEDYSRALGAVEQGVDGVTVSVWGIVLDAEDLRGVLSVLGNGKAGQ